MMIWFGNFFKIDGSADHTWQTVAAFLAKDLKVLQHLGAFDFDSVSGPAVKKIKN